MKLFYAPRIGIPNQRRACVVGTIKFGKVLKKEKHAMQLTIELPDRLGYRLKSIPNFNEFITKVLAQSIAPPVQEKDIQSDILSKAEQEEYEWLKTTIKNTAFESLSAPDEDIYTLADGKPFHDPEWSKNLVRDFTCNTITDTKLYTSDDGKPFHDKG